MLRSVKRIPPLLFSLLAKQMEAFQCWADVRTPELNDAVAFMHCNKSVFLCLPHLKHGNGGPQQRVEIFPVRQSVSAVLSQTEFTAKQMHPQNATQNHTKKHKKNNQKHINYCTIQRNQTDNH